MDRDSWLQHYESSPYAVQMYLLSPKSRDNEVNAQHALALENDIWNRVMDAVWELIFLGQNQIEWRNKLNQVLVDHDVNKAEQTLLFYIVLPLADLISWDVEARLQELGMRASEVQQAERISIRPVSYSAAVRRICVAAKLSVLSEDLLARLRDAFASYLSGVRTIEQFLEFLQRAQAEGGMGFSKAQTDQFKSTMDAFVDTTQILSEQDYSDWFTNYQRRKESEKLEADRVPNPTETGESAPSAAGLPRPVIEGSEVLVKAITVALERIGQLTLDEYLQKRLINIISTRFRDVRNAIQTKQVLSRDIKVGGVGLSEEEAERISGVIETTYAEQRALIEADERERIQAVMSQQSVKVEERKQRESEEHARWYAEKVQSARPETFLKQPVSAAPSAFAPVGQAAPVRPVMDSVVPPPPKLMGIEDELAAMTWSSFRRLSNNPQQAAEKVAQKIETLKQESFDRWTNGLQAWRQSPLQQEYLKLVTESFSAAKPVGQLVEERRASNPDLPSPEEVGAVIALNARLQS